MSFTDTFNDAMTKPYAKFMLGVLVGYALGYNQHRFGGFEEKKTPKCHR